jgi:hypothetical protein
VQDYIFISNYLSRMKIGNYSFLEIYNTNSSSYELLLITPIISGLELLLITIFVVLKSNLNDFVI